MTRDWERRREAWHLLTWRQRADLFHRFCWRGGGLALAGACSIIATAGLLLLMAAIEKVATHTQTPEARWFLASFVIGLAWMIVIFAHCGIKALDFVIQAQEADVSRRVSETRAMTMRNTLERELLAAPVATPRRL